MESGTVLIAGGEQEATRALADLMDQLLDELRLDLRLAVVSEAAGPDAAALRAHQPLGLVLIARGAPLRRALLAIATFSRDLPLMLVTETDPQALAEADVLAQLYRPRCMIRVAGQPTVANMTAFLFHAGRHGGRGRLIPMSG